MSFSAEQIAAIKNMQDEKSLTKRATVPAIEEILYQPIKVLDHGFVRVVDYMGDDSAIVQAARVSYGKGTKKLNEDQGLINYLMRHWHTTPFEMCEIKLHVKLPIFIARQWIRHRTANVNEYSARYSILDKEFYIPRPQNLAAQSQTNKQGRAEILDGEEAAWILQTLKDESIQAYDYYLQMMNLDEATGETLNEKHKGLARELARMNLPTNYYTQWYWKIDLNNLLHFLRLRADAHAQFEIQEYARVILDIVAKWVPYTYEAFLNYRLNSKQISASGWQVIKKMLAGQQVDQESSGMSKREWAELMSALKE
jgi:thymidylate synthase (FAD)